MKKIALLIVGLLAAGLVSADVIFFGYDGSPLLSAGGGTPNYKNVAGVDSYLSWSSADNPIRSDAGSTDTTWGSFVGDNAAFVSTSGNFNRGSIGIDDTESLFISITNNTSNDIELNEIHVDYKRAVWNSLNAVGVMIMGGDLADSGYQGNLVFSTNSGTPDQSDWEDAEFSLASTLTDNVLAPGEYVLVELRGSSALDSRPNAVYFDNIAVSGVQVVPEPATLGLFVISSGAVLLIRKHIR